MLPSLRFEFVRNDRPVYVLASPSPCFGTTRFFTRPYRSPSRGDDTFNVLVGYTRKHDCDLAAVAASGRGFVEATAPFALTLEEAKELAGGLRMPLIVLLSGDGDGDGDGLSPLSSTDVAAAVTPAFFFDPKRHPSEFRKELRSLSSSAAP